MNMSWSPPCSPVTCSPISCLQLRVGSKTFGFLGKRTTGLSRCLLLYDSFPLSAYIPRNTFEDREKPPSPSLIVNGRPKYLIERIIDPKCNCVHCECTTSSGLATQSPPLEMLCVRVLDRSAVATLLMVVVGYRREPYVRYSGYSTRP